MTTTTRAPQLVECEACRTASGTTAVHEGTGLYACDACRATLDQNPAGPVTSGAGWLRVTRPEGLTDAQWRGVRARAEALLDRLTAEVLSARIEGREVVADCERCLWGAPTAVGPMRLCGACRSADEARRAQARAWIAEHPLDQSDDGVCLARGVTPAPIGNRGDAGCQA